MSEFPRSSEESSGLYIPSMIWERAYGPPLLKDWFYREFFPDSDTWAQGARLKREVTYADLEGARHEARLDEVDALLTLVRHQNGSKEKIIATPDQRLFVWLRDGGKCRYCETNASIYRVGPHGERISGNGEGLNPDHYDPYALGGETVTDNLVCACNKCNIAKFLNKGEAFDRLAKHPNFSLYRNALYWDRPNARVPLYVDRAVNDQRVIEANEIMYPNA